MITCSVLNSWVASTGWTPRQGFSMLPPMVVVRSSIDFRQKNRLEEMSWVSRRKEAPIRSKASQILSRG